MLEKAQGYSAKEAAFGRSTHESFAKFDPVSSLWKIPHFLFAGELSKFSGKWPRWGMMVRGECYPLPTWEAVINATDFGERSGDVIEYLTPCENGLEGGANGMTPEERRAEYPVRVTMKTRKRLAAAESAPWPTPCAHDKLAGTSKPHGFIVDGVERQRNLNDMVARTESAPWPTPRAGGSRSGLDGGSNSRKAARKRGHYIPNSVSAWPTPTANDYKGSGKNGDLRDRLDYAVERGATKSHTYPTIGTKTMGGCSGSQHKLEELERIGAQRTDERRVLQSGNGGVANCGWLNPDWIEWMMNWPQGWTDPDATELVWLLPEYDPADLAPDADGYVPRITGRKEYRIKRVETLGNGQFPLTAVAAFIFGRAILAAALTKENHDTADNV